MNATFAPLLVLCVAAIGCVYALDFLEFGAAGPDHGATPPPPSARGRRATHHLVKIPGPGPARRARFTLPASPGLAHINATGLAVSHVKATAGAHEPPNAGTNAAEGSQLVNASAAARNQVLVSALSKTSRLLTVQRSLEHFAPRSWDCTVFTWNPEVHEALLRGDERGDDVGAAAEEIAKRCAVVYRKGWRWASLLNTSVATEPTSHPAPQAEEHAFTFVMLDDIVLPRDRDGFDIDALVDLARKKSVDVLSPIVHGGSRPWMRQSDEDRRRAAGINAPSSLLSNPPGSSAAELRMVNAVEVYATLYTAAAWRCFASMFDNEVLGTATGAVGYGYDTCWAAHCARWPAIHGRLAIALKQSVLHDDQYLRRNSTSANASAEQATTPADGGPPKGGRRLALAMGDYGGQDLNRLGLEQMKRLTRWVWKRDHKRCAHMAPRARESTGWSAYE